MEYSLSFDGVVFRYPDTAEPALKELSFKVPKGSRTAVLGHNGSGKSTLFLHAVGVLRPQQGCITVSGRPLAYTRKELARLRRTAGLVFQDPEQQLILSTPQDDISFGLRGTGMDEREIRRRCSEVIELLKLEEFKDKPVHQLSLGQKKRTALAGVLAMEPELILLDEPTAYLDPMSEAQLLSGLENIHAAGTTIVMATHDMNLAYRWADWIIVLDRGSCLAEGTPGEIFAGHAALQAAGLGLPLLADLWYSLPGCLTAGYPAPRTAVDFKDILQQLLGSTGSSK
ncbi:MULTISPECIES: ABC transporter ATP-binding protein [unclassified Paenibacillus]|uniref:energy-coupling factor ABC transporter ATP-binding protein n=1 Tax=unclassified Paenibacillus TaxID=185978 RepID=UPI00240730DE|nr:MULTISPECIES: ABC transporter ATP-binding protein [unclassified Paenibacillus]MDF9844233.1 cobalt/nickel transport system ATP-binding protein [Paenibacillus sp. PastF-2]MDF9850838.1 cobalt/nickel transport system ATP-binding protein [Paenibacillus sp. PastM-2]MDF9857399.1 cobalt/nickel transport system ATP-binding protein [Paenibacillus sp. PastF-1]MDH6482667.1 cobalt/nickel transport system ATP-binding protein [Paenibacillus sp. PastH-2]MDH6510103.1 cobalt/nickel transport system ATP-bindi